ncbi:carbohydrate porin [Gloeocapsopsis crepidinum]|nr:carbohydrate porin [Gloeocapsopsis crepidinum]
MSQTVPDCPIPIFLNQFKLFSLLGVSVIAVCLLEVGTNQPAQANSEQHQHIDSQLIAQLPSLPNQNTTPPNFNYIQSPQVAPGTLPNYNQYLAVPSGIPYGSRPPAVSPAKTWQEELAQRNSNYPNQGMASPSLPPVAPPQPNMLGSGSIAPGVMTPYSVVQPYVPQAPANIYPGAIASPYPYGVVGSPTYVQPPVTSLPVPASPGIPQANSPNGDVLPPAPGSPVNGMMVPYGVPTQQPYLPPMPQPNALGMMMVPYGVPTQQPYLAPPNAIGGNAVPLAPGYMIPYGVPVPQLYLPPMPQPNAGGMSMMYPGGMTSYAPVVNQNAAVGQQVFPAPVGSYLAPATTQLPPPLNTVPPTAPSPNLAPAPPTPIPNQGTIQTPTVPALDSQPVSNSALQLQGVYSYQGDESSARARVGAVYPLTPRILVGATVDLTDGNAFADSRTQGLNLNEFYLATSLENVPNLRFVIGQLDLTSYFDRNSFAKDGASQFFNPVFQTNPALVSTGVNSRPGALVNWTVTDNIEAKAAIFSSSRAIGDFALDGFATEVGIRYGNAIIRGTYATDRDAGTQDGFQEAFQVARSDGDSGILRSDREESYGVNAEVYIPNLKMGLFGRYGRYENRDLELGGDTYSLGVSFLDVFSPDDRLGLAYGRSLSNDRLRRQAGNDRPDVLELYYDFRFLSNLRLGFTFQERNNFSETIFGFRLKTEFNVTPIESIIR